MGDGRRKRTRAFTGLQPHYLFEDRFGRPGKGNDKGKVEGMEGCVRRNFLVPVPSFESFEALNACLERRCLERMDSRLRGHAETIGQRMERDLEVLMSLPAVAYDACEKQAGRVSSLVRCRTNGYSAPVACGHRDVLVRGYVDRVVISCSSEVIARHPRSCERDDFVYDPVRYLPLLEQKTNALDQAAPLQEWDCPRSSAHCADCWSPAWDQGASGSSSRCCGCWEASGSPSGGLGPSGLGGYSASACSGFGIRSSGGCQQRAPDSTGPVPSRWTDRSDQRS